VLPKSPAATSYLMAAIFAVAGVVLIAVSAFAGYQFLGLGLIAFLTGAGWVVKALRARTDSSGLEEV
jgi:hypothetical protein